MKTETGFIQARSIFSFFWLIIIRNWLNLSHNKLLNLSKHSQKNIANNKY